MYVNSCGITFHLISCHGASEKRDKQTGEGRERPTTDASKERERKANSRVQAKSGDKTQYSPSNSTARRWIRGGPPGK